MTFLVGDSQSARHAKIRNFLSEGEVVIAVLLSAADFEWTVRRGILALGISPNVDIRKGVLSKCSGLDGYKKAWKEEVKKHLDVGLPEVIGNWESFKNAFELRHRLVHGIAGTAGEDYARPRVEAVMRGSVDVAKFAQVHSIDLFGRLPIRRRKTTT